MNRAIFALALLAPALVLASCGFGRSEPERPYLPPEIPVSRTREEVLEFANRIAETINNGDPSLLNGAIDYEALGQRATSGMINGEQVRKGLVAGLRRNALLGSVMAEQTSNGAQLSLVNLDWNGACPRIFYRLDLPSGVNYFELRVGDDPGGNCRIVDIRNFLDGELMSVQIHRMMTHPRTILSFLPGAGPSLTQALDTLNKLQAGGFGQSALDYYATLPEDLRNDRVVMARWVIAAKTVDTGRYHQALRSMHDVFAGDHSCDLLFIDLFTFEHQWDSVTKAIDGVDSAVGGDPHLDLLRAGFLIAQKDYDAASTCVFRYMARDSASSTPWLSLVDIYVGEKRYTAATAALDTLTRRFGITFNTQRLEGLKGYGEFVASPEYQAWKRRHPSAG